MPEFPDLLSWSSTTQNYLYYHQIHVEDNMLQIKINQNGFRMVAFKDRCMIINYRYPRASMYKYKAGWIYMNFIDWS